MSPKTRKAPNPGYPLGADPQSSQDPYVWLGAAIRALTYVASKTTPEMRDDLETSIEALDALLDVIKMAAGIDE